MLISYPVLPPAAVNDDEEMFLDNILEAHLLEYEGRYPVTTMNTARGPMHRWHGGVHLFGGGEPIRAIADGTVVAFRFAAQSETYGELGAYDTGFVLLRHETQTGENTTVVFYSLYMHLASQADLAADRLVQLPRWLRQSTGPAVRRPADQRIWRKDVLGFAGQLYNREAMHFEVFMLDADFQRVWRDSASVTQGTGSDDWFGDAHFVIPAGQRFADRHPRAPSTGAHRIDLPDSSTDFPLPLGEAGQNDQTLYVSVSLNKGRRTATTYRAAAGGGYETVGAEVVQEDYEYELYRLATALYPDCPSAGLEWLRFGRVLGSDTTARDENWQLIRYSETAMGYINLAPDCIAKLSDADFPHWHGWEKRDEGETANAADGICDDERTLALSQASDGDSKRKLRHLVCRAPSEWDHSDLRARYAQLGAPGQSLENPADWDEFEAHVAKLAFWAEAGLGERSVWHFHPLQFIRHFRKCGWLSQSELVQCLPRRFLAQHHKSRTVYRSTIPLSQARVRVHAVHGELNRALRKHAIDTRLRQTVFLANATVESTYFSQFFEGGRGAGHRYRDWYGRGIIQVTWRDNYLKYFRYRGRPLDDSNAFNRWRDQVETDPAERCESAGFWWSVNSANRHASVHAGNERWKVVVCDDFDWQLQQCKGKVTQEERLSNPTLDAVGRLVNTGSLTTTVPVNGLVERRDIFIHVQSVLLETFYSATPDSKPILTSAPFVTPQR